MKVESFKNDNGKTIYILLDNEFKPVESAMKYLKYLDGVNKSSHTLKTYANALRLYFKYLDIIDKDYKNININDLSNFIEWLKNPYEYKNVTSLNNSENSKAISTINLTITVILNFYDYLYRTGVLEFNLMDNTIKEMYNSKPNNKGFLAHLNQDTHGKKNILKIKENKSLPQYLEKNEVELLINATNNIRDKFLIQLLYETGFRIGEALSLHHEDFIINKKKNIYEIKLTERGYLENGASLKTGERTVPVSSELADLFDDYEYEILDELGIHSPFIFIKISGDNIGKPLEYSDVDNIFRRLSKKTNIYARAHMLRHTHATTFYRETGDVEAVRDRLGHANISTTIDLYVHSNQEDKRRAWNKAENAFNVNKIDINYDDCDIPF